MTKSVAIVDYGVSNLFNVSRMIEAQGAKALITKHPEEVLSADGVILPGVGAFPEAMRQLAANELIAPIQERAKQNKPILGICLGMQLLLTSSDEGGFTKGLNIIPGKVEKIPGTDLDGKVVKRPHIGWNRLYIKDAKSSDALLKELPDFPFVYFLHSFFPRLDDLSFGVAETLYGGRRFYTMIRSGAIVGCQFHPERSGEAGERMLSNFIDCL